MRSSLSPGAIAARGSTLCAAGSGILASADGGAHWLAASAATQYDFAAAQALSATDIWAVERGGALLHSTDGVHWLEQARPTRWAQQLSGLSFPDASDGWLVGTGPAAGPFGDQPGVIFHTSDGGATWQPQSSNLGGGLAAVDFTDASHGWAVSEDSNGSDVGAAAPLEYTTDGGVHWIPQYVPANPSLTCVDFRSATTGWVGGYDSSSSSGNTAPAIYGTTNGGLDWVREPLPAGAPQIITALQFLDTNNGWAVGFNYDGNRGSLLHTTDGGTSWSHISGLDAALNAVHFTDAQHGWVAGNGVYATSDGGASWQRVADGDGLSALAASDATHLWALGSGLLLSTIDVSGDTAPPSTFDDSYAFWHRSAATIDFTANDVGGSGVAKTEYSTDGGTSWQTGTQVTIPAPAGQANDGVHSLLYRSTDLAGNIEATEFAPVGIDTLGPGVSAPTKAIVNSGQKGILRFTANDSTSGVARAVITIADRKGHEVRRFTLQAGHWSTEPVPPYWWLGFKCDLKPGSYRIEVRATDGAGNPQISVGTNQLKVVAKGAPRVRTPGWPSGLPDNYQPGGAYAAPEFGAGAGRAPVGPGTAPPTLPAWLRNLDSGH